MAALSLATGIGPADLLAAPPEVYAELARMVAEQAERQAREARRRDLSAKLKAGLR